MVIFRTSKKNTEKKNGKKIVCRKMGMEKNVCGDIYVLKNVCRRQFLIPPPHQGKTAGKRDSRFHSVLRRFNENLVVEKRVI